MDMPALFSLGIVVIVAAVNEKFCSISRTMLIL